MGKPGDVSPEVASAVSIGVVGAAIEYARKHMPEMVEQLEAVRLVHAKRLVDLTPP